MMPEHGPDGGRAGDVWGMGLVGTVIKFPDEGRIVRFGRTDADESATVIILPVVRIERYSDPEMEPHSPPPAQNGGSRRMRRR
jgi:hypothetical protein